jgi:hypothetical protein
MLQMNYKNGKIYKILCNLSGKVYIGSTCMPQLSQRLAKHKCDYKRYLQGKTNKMMSSYEVLKNNNYEIVLLELYQASLFLQRQSGKRFEKLQDFYKSMRETYKRHYDDRDLDIRSKLKSDITMLKDCLDDMSKFLTKNNYQDQRLSIPTCGDDDELTT